jgi:type II secretion system protein H
MEIFLRFPNRAIGVNRFCLPRMQRRAGFTLLELLLVLFIIGAAAAVTYPRITGTVSRARLDAAAGRVAAALRHARDRACLTGRIHRVEIDPARGRVTIQPQAAGGLAAWPHDDGKKEPGEEPETFRLDEGLRFIDDGDPVSRRVVFYPLGNARGGRWMIADPAGRRVAIAVDFITGGVHMEALAGREDIRTVALDR